MYLRNPEVLRGFVGKGPGRVMNARELAERIGRTRGTVDHLLNGRMDRCSVEVATAIEGELGVPAGILFVTTRTIEKPARRNMTP